MSLFKRKPPVEPCIEAISVLELKPEQVLVVKLRPLMISQRRQLQVQRAIDAAEAYIAVPQGQKALL